MVDIIHTFSYAEVPRVSKHTVHWTPLGLGLLRHRLICVSMLTASSNVSSYVFSLKGILFLQVKLN